MALNSQNEKESGYQGLRIFFEECCDNKENVPEWRKSIEEGHEILRYDVFCGYSSGYVVYLLETRY
jgi:hypothetical protein